MFFFEKPRNDYNIKFHCFFITTQNNLVLNLAETFKIYIFQCLSKIQTILLKIHNVFKLFVYS